MNLKSKCEAGTFSIAVVIPAFKVRQYIDQVLSDIGDEVGIIYVVDDCCPEGSGEYVAENCKDPRVSVLNTSVNSGVGGATLTGFRKAAADGADILVKLDGDGQMNPGHIPQLVAPIVNGDADYSKGNRFYDFEMVSQMPLVRLIGNLALSFMTKMSSGYWKNFDPTNGFVAIHSKVFNQLPVEKISKRFFFESDMLFRLGTLQAVVADVPMKAIYGNESSNLNSLKMILPFFYGHIKNFHKRIFYNYFLRDFTLASLELVIGSIFLVFGVVFGAQKWKLSIETGVPVTSGTVMLAALPIIVGIQMLLSFFSFDISNSSSMPIHKKL